MPRRAFLFIIILVLLLMPASAQAQAVIIDTMQVDLWPEYDRPEVLVIYRFSLAAATSLPAEVTLRIPASSGGPYNLAFQDLTSSGELNLFNLEYTTEQEGDWILVSFTAPTTDLQLEYYDPGIQTEGKTRTYTYTWPADYTVRSISVQVQQPRNAEGMQTEPELDAGEVLQDGLTYYNGLFGEIEAGEEFSVRFSYEKADDSLSQGFDPVFPAEPAADSSAAATTFENVWPWILGGFGTLLVLGVVIWYLAPRRPQSRAPRKRHTASPPNKIEQGPAGVFCHNCGTRSQAGDVFCRSCGARLRQ